MKTGRPAFEPKIISLLRTVLTPARGWGGMDPVILERAYVDLEAIVKAWVKNEDIDELKEALGVSPPRGRPRTNRQVREEKKIVESVIAAARTGLDVSTYSKAANALNVDEKQIERAWNAWGESLTLGMRRNKAADEGKLAELRAHFTAEAAAAAEQFPHMASLFNTPEAIEISVERTREKAIKFPGEAAALIRLPPLPDIK